MGEETQSEETYSQDYAISVLAESDPGHLEVFAEINVEAASSEIRPY